MRLFYPNIIDAAGVGITSTSAATGLPASNVAHEFKTKVWRTGTSTAAESITFDLVSAKAATSAIIFAHTLLAGDSSIQLRGSTDNFAASNVLAATFTWSAGPMLATFSSASYRYWRVTFNKASAGVSRDIGRIFLGTYYETTVQPDWDGFESTPTDRSTSQQSVDGQTYTNRRSQFRTLSLSFSDIPSAQSLAFKAAADALGTHTSFFQQTDPAGSGEVAEVWYVKFAKLSARQVSGMDSDLVWNLDLEMEEQL